MLATRTLWFSRIDQFTDQLEGTKPMNAPPSQGEQHLFDSMGVTGWSEQYPGASEEQRFTHFGLCWHMNSKENSRMWHEYTPDGSCAVAIVGSVKSIQRGLRHAGRTLRYSPVKYLGPDDPHPQLDYDSIFFYKNREKYAHEKEFRILTSLLPSEMPFRLDGEGARCRTIRFDTHVGIQRIVFHPAASISFKKDIRKRFRSVFASVRHAEDSCL